MEMFESTQEFDSSVATPRGALASLSAADALLESPHILHRLSQQWQALQTRFLEDLLLS